MSGGMAELEEWFYENEISWVIPFIEKNFSSDYARESEYYYLKEHLFLCKKLIDNDMLTNEEKLMKFYKMISYGKSKIIMINGGRGSGKTAFAFVIIEELHKDGYHKNIFYVKTGDRPEWLPNWIKHVQVMEEVPNKSFAIIDETAITYSSRNFYSEENKSFTDRLVILRHKDVSVLLITQHTKLIDINIRRLADIIIHKKGANIEQEGKDGEDKYLLMKRLMPRDSKGSLIEIKQYNCFWKVETGLASFWDDELVSKTFKDYDPEAKRRSDRNKKDMHELDKIKAKEEIKNEYRAARELNRARTKISKEEISPEDLYN
jgi:hypothetical protein